MNVEVGNPPPAMGDEGGFDRFRDDRRLLITFVNEVHDLLEAIVEAGLVGDQLSGLQTEAWSVVGGRFTPIVNELTFGDIDEELVARGLTGAELRFKIGVVDRGLSRVRETAESVFERIQAIPASGVDRILGAVDDLLGSLAFIPGVEAVVEFKDATRSAISFEART